MERPDYGGISGREEQVVVDLDVIRVLYRSEGGTWSAHSPDVSNWLAVADTFEDCRRLAEDGVRFALEREDLIVEHFVPAPA